MARGNAIVGNFQGKLGNVVGYNLKNAKTKGTQGMRAYQPNVTNPRTRLQASQRMLIGPAMKFYQWLIDPINSRPLCDHSFENTEYGVRSMRKFLSLAMKKKDGPFIIKGTSFAIPAAYQISQGSLPSVNVEEMDDNYIYTDLSFGEDIDINFAENPPTVGYISNAILSKNSWLKDGDQLTFVWCWQIQDRFSFQISRIILDSSDTRTCKAAGFLTGISRLGYVQNEDQEHYGKMRIALFVDYTSTEVSPYLATAFGIIVSRKSNEKWLRSDCTLELSPSMVSLYYSDPAYNAAVASYQNTATRSSSDEYLNDAGSAIVQLTYLNVEEVGNRPIVVGISDTGKQYIIVFSSENAPATDGVLYNMAGAILAKKYSELPEAVRTQYPACWGMDKATLTSLRG